MDGNEDPMPPKPPEEEAELTPDEIDAISGGVQHRRHRATKPLKVPRAAVPCPAPCPMTPARLPVPCPTPCPMTPKD